MADTAVPLEIVDIASLHLCDDRRIDVRRHTRRHDGVGRSSYQLSLVNTLLSTAVTGVLTERDRGRLLAALEGATPPVCHGCEENERRRRWTTGEFDRLYALIARLRAAATVDATPPMCRRPEELAGG